MEPEVDLQQVTTYNQAVAAGLPVFKVLSDGEIKAYKDEKGVRRFKLTASSDANDLVGDAFTQKALDRMQSSAEGTTMFLNHDYNVPEDVFGVVETATLVTKQVKDRHTGQMHDCLCLEYDGVVTETNPRAVSTHEMMLEGRVRLGASVTVLIIKKIETKDGRRLIDDVYYLECSIVGIPCNPTAWVVSASKALKLFEKRQAAPIEKNCPSCKALVDTMHDFSQSPCPQCKWLATPDAVAARMANNAASDAPGAESDAPASASTTKESAMKEGYSYVVARKGMFNDALAAEESSLYHLLNVLWEALYDLYYKAVYYDTDVDAKAELELICDEFKAVLVDRFLPKLVADDSEAKSIERLHTIAKSVAWLGGDAMSKGIEAVLKEGRRNATGDQKMIEEIHRLSVDLGASCATEKAADPATAQPTAEAEPKESPAQPTTKTASAESGNPAPEPTAAPEAPPASQASGEPMPVTKSVEEQLSDLRAQLATANATAERAVELAESALLERDQWKASSLEALAALEQHGEQPLPRHP